MKNAITKSAVKTMIKKTDKKAVAKDKIQDKKMMGNGVLKKAKDCKY